MAKEEKKEVKKEKPKKAESKAIKCTTIFLDVILDLSLKKPETVL